MWSFDPSGAADELGLSVGSPTSWPLACRTCDHVSLNHSPKPDQFRRSELSAIPPPSREQISFSEPSTKS